ncbi:MAG: NADH-quinone oxidoreductase subunit F, partial [Ignavibacterium sp.]|nr:NADH-quinone oxidoreductase subunit F [Ignavibacterium sp.]
MKNFDQLCCEKCWHTPQTPCEHFIQCCTEGPLCHSDEKCKIEISSLRKRLRYEEHDKPIIIIGMGTCGLAS